MKYNLLRSIYSCSVLLLGLATSLFTGCHRKKPVEEVNWVLKNKNFYRYAVNKFGRVDTTFMTAVFYESALPKDSSQYAIVFTYKDGNPYESFALKKVGTKYSSQSITMNQYNEFGLLTSHIMQRHDSVLMERTFKYDSARRLAEEMDVKLGDAEPGAMEFASLLGTYSGTGYDTTILKFSYDKTGLTSSIEVFDGRRRPKYTIVNIFSGSDPVTTYRIGSNGDTLETTRYSKESRALKSTITGKEFRSTELRYKGKLLVSIFENEKTNKKSKLVNRYNRQGMLMEEDHYASE